MPWSVIGAALLALFVIIGAFGAHALRGQLDTYSLGIYDRAVFYHAVHAMGLLIVGITVKLGVAAPGLANVAGWLFFAGIILFSGSLYALAITGVKALGAITPLGGLAFIAGWIVFAVALAGANARG